MSDADFPVGETPAQIQLPPVPAVYVLNTSGGIGDRDNAPDVVVNNSADCSLNPQQGCRLPAGRSMTLPLTDMYGHTLPLWAVADGPNAQLTIQLITCD